MPLSNLLKKEIVKTIFRMKTRKPKPATELQIGKESAVKLKAKTSRLRRQTIWESKRRLS